MGIRRSALRRGGTEADMDHYSWLHSLERPLSPLPEALGLFWETLEFAEFRVHEERTVRPREHHYGARDAPDNIDPAGSTVWVPQRTA